ncbi:MAG: hypothetical protein AAF211_02720 [Myxococcota bacterium]
MNIEQVCPPDLSGEALDETGAQPHALAVAVGQSRRVFVGGLPGVGKTTLVREIIGRDTSLDVRWLDTFAIGSVEELDLAMAADRHGRGPTIVVVDPTDHFDRAMWSRLEEASASTRLVAVGSREPGSAWTPIPVAPLSTRAEGNAPSPAARVLGASAGEPHREDYERLAKWLAGIPAVLEAARRWVERLGPAAVMLLLEQDGVGVLDELEQSTPVVSPLRALLGSLSDVQSRALRWTSLWNGFPLDTLALGHLLGGPDASRLRTLANMIGCGWLVHDGDGLVSLPPLLGAILDEERPLERDEASELAMVVEGLTTLPPLWGHGVCTSPMAIPTAALVRLGGVLRTSDVETAAHVLLLACDLAGQMGDTVTVRRLSTEVCRSRAPDHLRSLASILAERWIPLHEGRPAVLIAGTLEHRVAVLVHSWERAFDSEPGERRTYLSELEHAVGEPGLSERARIAVLCVLSHFEVVFGDADRADRLAMDALGRIRKHEAFEFAPDLIVKSRLTLEAAVVDRLCERVPHTRYPSGHVQAARVASVVTLARASTRFRVVDLRGTVDIASDVFIDRGQPRSLTPTVAARNLLCISLALLGERVRALAELEVTFDGLGAFDDESNKAQFVDAAVTVERVLAVRGGWSELALAIVSRGSTNNSVSWLTAARVALGQRDLAYARTCLERAFTVPGHAPASMASAWHLLSLDLSSTSGELGEAVVHWNALTRFLDDDAGSPFARAEAWLLGGALAERLGRSSEASQRRQRAATLLARYSAPPDTFFHRALQAPHPA